MTDLGSTCRILKSNDSLAMNISLSSRSSLTDGGGRAIAKATRPMTLGGEVLLESPDGKKREEQVIMQIRKMNDLVVRLSVCKCLCAKKKDTYFCDSSAADAAFLSEGVTRHEQRGSRST